MKLVVDASVAIKWVVGEEGHDAARQLLFADHELIAPDFLLVEAANILWKKVRRRELLADHSEDMLAAVAYPLQRLTRSDAYASRALSLGVELDHPIYDCLYLAAAEAERAVVVTADSGLLRAVVGSPYGGLAVSLDEIK